MWEENVDNITPRLVQGLKDLGIDAGSAELKRLEAYLQELLIWNRKFNLIGRGDRDLVARHLLDSLSGLSFFTEVLSGSFRMADVGSGAGLPGIPLMVFLKAEELLLIERSGKRAGFLRNAVPAAGLSSTARVLEADVSRVSEQVDVLCMRAFRSIPDALPLVDHLIPPGGWLFDYHGRRSTVDEELSHSSVQGWDWEVFPLRFGAEGEERHLVRGRKH